MGTVSLSLRRQLRDSTVSMPDVAHPLSSKNSGTLLGTSIDHDRLRLETIIGSGGTCVVFRALDVSDGREYAVKCMPRGTRMSETHARHVRERSLHLRVNNHPGIVTLHRAFAQGGHVFFVLDLYTGGDLYSAIERGVFVRKNDLVRNVFLQLCDAVAHCHACGIYHLDVKPENVVCDRQISSVALTDFGLATTRYTCSARLPGSKLYAPPECYHNFCSEERTIPTAASDVWALGIVLINLITTVNPWHVAEPTDPKFALYIRHPLSYFDPLHLPSDVEALILCALTVDPFERISLEDMRKTIQTVPRFFPMDEHDDEDSDADSDEPEMHIHEPKVSHSVRGT